MFSSSDPRFGYDIVLAVGKRNQLSDGVKYQILTSRDYLPEKFEYPQSLTTDFKKYRRCIVELLNKFEFLRYCVNCVLFSNSTEKRKTPLRAREIWATWATQMHCIHSLLNVNTNKASDHALCVQKANHFLQTFQGNHPPIIEQLDDHKQAQVSNNRHIMVEILKIINRLGKKNLAIHQEASHKSNF